MTRSADGETGTLLVRAANLPANVRTPNVLRLIRQGNRYIFYINNVYVNQIVDDEIDVSRVGTEIFVCKGRNANLVFDNFELRSP